MVLLVAFSSVVGKAPELLWGLLNILTLMAFFPMNNINAPEFVNIFCANLYSSRFFPKLYPLLTDIDYST